MQKIPNEFEYGIRQGRLIGINFFYFLKFKGIINAFKYRSVL